MQQHNARAILINKIKARKEQTKQFNITSSTENALIQTANLGHHLADSADRTDVRFTLMDYRDNNKHLASRVMSRYEAGTLNNRLRDTGFAWAQTGGY